LAEGSGGGVKLASRSIDKLAGAGIGLPRGDVQQALMYVLPPVLRQLRLDHPGIDLIVTNMSTRDSVESLIENKIDIAIVTLPVEKKHSG
jgi:DNA-binding transcriptional LysR family regulator